MVEFYSGKFFASKEDGLLRQGKNWNKKIFMCTFDYEFKNVSNFFAKRCKSLIARNDKFFKWIMVKVWSVIRRKYSTCLVHLFTVTMVIVLSEKIRDVSRWKKNLWKLREGQSISDQNPRENGQTMAAGLKMGICGL